MEDMYVCVLKVQPKPLDIADAMKALMNADPDLSKEAARRKVIDWILRPPRGARWDRAEEEL